MAVQQYYTSPNNGNYEYTTVHPSDFGCPSVGQEIPDLQRFSSGVPILAIPTQTQNSVEQLGPSTQDYYYSYQYDYDSKNSNTAPNNYGGDIGNHYSGTPTQFSGNFQDFPPNQVVHGSIDNGFDHYETADQYYSGAPDGREQLPTLFAYPYHNNEAPPQENQYDYAAASINGSYHSSPPDALAEGQFEPDLQSSTFCSKESNMQMQYYCNGDSGNDYANLEVLQPAVPQVDSYYAADSTEPNKQVQQTFYDPAVVHPYYAETGYKQVQEYASVGYNESYQKELALFAEEGRPADPMEGLYDGMECLNEFFVPNQDWCQSEIVYDEPPFTPDDLEERKIFNEVVETAKDSLPVIKEIALPKLQKLPMQNKVAPSAFCKLVNSLYHQRQLVFGATKTSVSQCNICQNFSNSNAPRDIKQFMRRHLFLHMRQYPHYCLFCGNCQTTNAGKVRAHIKKAHSHEVSGKLLESYVADRTTDLEEELCSLAKKCYEC